MSVQAKFARDICVPCVISRHHRQNYRLGKDDFFEAQGSWLLEPLGSFVYWGILRNVVLVSETAWYLNGGGADSFWILSLSLGPPSFGTICLCVCGEGGAT